MKLNQRSLQGYIVLLIYVPMSGPKLYTAIADARSRGENKSPIDPAPHAIGALPVIPARTPLETVTVL